MPTAHDMRAAAWRKMKEGGLFPLIAGFSLVSLLGIIVQSAASWYFMSCGWITESSLLDAMRNVQALGIPMDELTPEQEEALGATFVLIKSPACWIADFLINAMWNNGILEFGCAVLAVSAMRGGASSLLVLSGFRGSLLLRTAALGVLRFVVVGLGLLLLIVPGILAHYSYRMASYLLADNPDWSPWRALRESRRLMHGHRWRLACLDTSFIGWFLLVGLMSVNQWLGYIALIFVLPYFMTANAAFYEDLLDRTGR